MLTRIHTYIHTRKASIHAYNNGTHKMTMLTLAGAKSYYDQSNTVQGVHDKTSLVYCNRYYYCWYHYAVNSISYT